MSDVGFDDIKAFVALQSKEVQKNVTIVSPQQMGYEFALHIDKNTPAAFVPRMPRSASNDENDTCARITVAGTLLGCYLGYYRAETDITEPKDNETDRFLGGYTICKLAFDQALKPTSALVWDAPNTEELWLVAYTPATAKYLPVKIGKMFTTSLTYAPSSGKNSRVSVCFSIENNETCGLWLTKDIKLDVGYYAIEVSWDNSAPRNIAIDKKDLVVTPITKLNYEAQKNRVAAFLCRYSDALPSRPTYLSW